MDNNTKIDEENKLAYAFQQLIKTLWNKDYNAVDRCGEKAFEPEEFIEIVIELGYHTKDKPGDPNNFLTDLLPKLNDNLKTNTKPTYYKKPDHYDRDSSRDSYLSSLQGDSIITKIFMHLNQDIQTCTNCYNSGITKNVYSYSMEYKFVVSLKEANDLKNSKQLEKTNYVTLQDCLYQYLKPSSLPMCSCSICQTISTLQISSSIDISPNVLILSLNRDQNWKCDVKVDFCEYLDITNFLYDKRNTQRYKLYGVITQIGNNANGHFIASCRSPIDGHWYKYNDSIVTRINDFVNEVANLGTTYILFYEKVTN